MTGDAGRTRISGGGSQPAREERIFQEVAEKDVTAAIVSEFTAQFLDYIESDCIVVGSGPAGLMAARDLARAGVKTLILERNNYMGGGFWIGGYLMNKVTVRRPADRCLDELGVPQKEVSPGLFVADGPHATAKLIAAALDAGAKVLNMTVADDVVLREGNRVAGVVINWSPISKLPREISCLDPVALECKMVIDSTGHDASVAQRLQDRGILKLEGWGPMWIDRSEDLVVRHTGELHPGLVVAGMAVSTAYGLPRMGPTFGSMLLSGERAAQVVLEKLGRKVVRKSPVAVG